MGVHPEFIQGQIVAGRLRRLAAGATKNGITYNRANSCLENGGKVMLRTFAVLFAVALASAAQATPLAPIQHTDNMIITVREACGAGMHRVAGVCVPNAAARCAVGMRWVGGRCIR